MNEKNECARYEELCSAAIDHALTEQEQKELDAHLAECPACRAYLEELRTMHDLWKELETPMPPALHEKIMSEIEAEVQKTIVQTPQKHRRRPPVFTMLAAAAACVLLAVTGNLTGLFGHVGTTTIQSSVADASTQTEVGPSTAEAGPNTNNAIMDGETPAQNNRAIPDDGQTLEPSADDSTSSDSSTATPDESESDASSSSDSRSGTAQTEPEDKTSNDAASDTQPESNESAGIAPASIAPFSATAPSSRSANANSAAMPEEVTKMTFARCYTVTRTDSSPDSLPVIDGMTLIIRQSGTAYYSVENNESKIEMVLQELEKNGYTTALNQSSGITTQRDAKLILLLVQE